MPRRIETSFGAALALAAVACNQAPESQPGRTDQVYAYLLGSKFQAVTAEMECRMHANNTKVDPVEACSESISRSREAKAVLDRFRSEYPRETTSFETRFEPRIITNEPDGKTILTFVAREKDARSGQ